jgi:UDP-N-acetylglucosamine 1-carboxyvinyltransferase
MDRFAPEAITLAADPARSRRSPEPGARSAPFVDKLLIEGGARLRGTIPVSGAKNAALPILCASLLTDETLKLSNVPQLNDVRTMRTLLAQMGVAQDASAGTLQLRAARIDWPLAPYELVKTMRASILALGPLVARCGEARVSLPGGCAIGLRPVDQHVKGLQAMGADIDLDHGFIAARVSGRLKGTTFVFDVVSVTGTENLMMAATLASGRTVLENAAREPEIVDLARCLTAMGARIEGANQPHRHRGVESLAGAEHRIMRPYRDRHFAAAAAHAGRRDARGARRHAGGCSGQAAGDGASIDSTADTIRVRSAQLTPFNLRTAPYPAFPPTCRHR